MRFHLFTAFVLFALVSYVHCGCNKSGEEKDSDEGEVTQFFRNLGCDIKKGAEKISDTAKPWVDEIGKSAKKFGGTVADTFTDIKVKIAGAPDNSTVKADSASDKPTEQTLLASPSSLPQAQTPSSIDDRILLEVEQRCPPNQLADQRGHCRPIA